MRALRRAILVAAATLLPLVPAVAAGLPATIRLAAPEQGGGGKSFAGAGPVSLAHARKAIEAEFEKDGVAVEWKFFKGAGPAINEALAAQQLDIVFLGDLAGVIGRANGDLQLLKLAGTADIPVSTKGKAAALGIQSGAIATQDFIDKYPEALGRVVRVLVRQAQQASDEGKAAALYEQLAQISGQPVALFSSEFEGTSLKTRFSPLIDDGFVAGYRNVVAGARQLGIVRQSFEVDAWIEPRFVNAALRELKLEAYWAPAKADPVVATR